MNIPLLQKPIGPAALLLLISPLSAQETATADPTSLLDLIQQGGWAMYPLGLLMLSTFYLIFHCWAQTIRKRFVIPESINDLSKTLAARNIPAAQESLRRDDSALARLMTLSLTKARLHLPDANREGMEATFVEAAEGEENKVAQWINYLNVIATVAPMVGLLGTVSGMIGAFSKIGSGGMGKPEELAGSIGEALITTATGLVIGIPAMIAYFFYRNRLTSRMIDVGQTGGLLLDQLEQIKVDD